jgi:hypothetical protein
VSIVRLVVVLLFLLACARPARDHRPIIDDQPLESAASVRYPEMLRSVGVEGTASVRVALDRTGRVVPGSMRTLATTHELFVRGNRERIDRWSFPALANVSDSVTVDVRFYIRDDPGCPGHTPTVQDAIPKADVRERLTRGESDRPLLIVVACPYLRVRGGDVF